MTTTPASGTYFVSFSTTAAVFSKDVAAIFAIHKAGTIISHSARETHNISGHVHTIDIGIHTQAIITVNGSEAIDIRYKNSDSSTTVETHERSMILLKV